MQQIMTYTNFFVELFTNIDHLCCFFRDIDSSKNRNFSGRQLKKLFYIFERVKKALLYFYILQSSVRSGDPAKKQVKSCKTKRECTRYKQILNFKVQFLKYKLKIYTFDIIQRKPLSTARTHPVSAFYSLFYTFLTKHMHTLVYDCVLIPLVACYTL